MLRQGFGFQSSGSVKKSPDRAGTIGLTAVRVGLAVLCVSSAALSTPVLSTMAAPTPRSALDDSTTIAQTSIGATILYVNPASGQDAPTAGTSDGTAFKTITYAMQQAKPGTIVQLARGSYTKDTGEVFPIQIPQGVTLRGSEADKGGTVAIIGGNFYISKTFARQSATLLTANGVQVRGVTVTNPNTRGTGIWIESNNPEIQNCTFTNNNREGIFITGDSSPKVQQNVFFKNGGNGISAASNSKGLIEGNLFQDTGFGLAVSGNAAPLITSNRILENTDGLYINDNAKPILRNNVIENNKRDGIVATIAARPDLGTAEQAGNNTVRNNRQFDINNSTNGILYSVGNNLPTNKISGKVELVAATGGGGTSIFPDVQGHWAQAYIEALTQRSVITGFPDGTFKPNDPVTRAQYATIINKAFAPPPKTAALSFSDVSSSFWGFQSIQGVVKGGFMRGYEDGTFRSELRIPRVQVLVALSTGLSFPTPADTSSLLIFQDAAAIPGYAQNAVAAATTRRIVVNYPLVGQLNPNREATRGEVAALVYQALVSAGKADPIASPYIVTVSP
jgi:parallel beta-helix repeat protein